MWLVKDSCAAVPGTNMNITSQQCVLHTLIFKAIFERIVFSYFSTASIDVIALYMCWARQSCEELQLY